MAVEATTEQQLLAVLVRKAAGPGVEAVAAVLPITGSLQEQVEQAPTASP